MQNLSGARRARLGPAPLCAVLLVTMAAGWGGSAYAQVQTAQEAVQEGVTLFQEGRIPEAIDRLQRAGEAYPSEPLVWMVLGQVYEAARRPQDAIPLYRRVIELAPQSEDATRAAARLGQLGRDRETYEAAQRDFQFAVQALTAQDLPTAEANFRKVLDRIPAHLPSLLFLGNIAEQGGRDDEARSRWEAAVAIDPTFYPAQVSLGRLYERHGRVADAASAYRAAVDTKVAHPDVQFAARRLTQVGASPEQALQVRQWMEQAADSARAGRAEDTKQAFERVLSVLPNHAAANFGLGLMTAKRGQTIDAARMLKNGLEGDPDYYPALFLLAEIEAGQGQFEQALEHYKRVVELVGPRREGIEARRRLPRLEEAITELKALRFGLAIEARKSFDEGIEAFQTQDYEAAFKAFGRAAVLDDKNPYYVFNRGLAAFNLGNNLVAAQSFERVLQLAPTFGLAHFWLGVMFQTSAEQARDGGNLLEAQAEYKATVEKLGLAITHGEGAWYLEEAQTRRAASEDFLNRFQEGQGYLLVGGVLVVQNRLDEALAVFDASAKRFPYDYQPLLNIGAILTDRKEYDQAQAALEHAAKVNPKSPKPYLQMGFLFEVQERRDDAIAAYEKVIALAPEAPEPHASLGTVLLQSDRSAEATREFEKAVELSGGTSTPIVHWNLAFLYGQEGRNYEALRQYRVTRDLLAGRTEPEAVDLRRASEDNIAALEERLRVYRFTLRATPWAYDSNIGSARTNPIGEAYSQIGGTVAYWMINEPQLRLRGTLDHTQTYYLLFRQVVDTSTGLGASLDYTLTPVVDVSGSYRWSYGHGSDGPQVTSQSFNTSVTKRGQLPSGLTLGLSYGLSNGLGGSTTRTSTLGYSVSLSQTLGPAGTLATSFSASSNDSNRDDQVSQSKSIGLVYSRRLWGAVGASFTYSLGLLDFVNPTRETIVRGDQPVSSLVFRQATSKTYGLDFSYTFRNDLVISIGMNLLESESNFSLDRSEDLNELLNNLVQAAGSFSKRTMAVSVSKTF
ncbi:MAG: tetratricopeptide repeat protein [Nitrospirota bacterium]